MKESWIVLIFSGFIFNPFTVGALKAENATVTTDFADQHFQSGLFEMSIGSGAMFSPFILTRNRPVVNYTLTEVQFGYMLTQIYGSGIYRGNLETAVDVFGGGIFQGRGNYVSGGTLWLRYNFVPLKSRFVPFAQAGAGLTETDVDRRLEGENFNFNLELGVGVRYFVASNWSINLEYRYQHISNADLSSRNIGVNAQGPMLSVSHFF